MRPPSRSCPRTPARPQSAVGVRPICTVVLLTLPPLESYLYRLGEARYVAPMGRGLGPLQRAILDVLASANRLTISELAERTGRDPRQVRAAVEALERRGLVGTERTAIGRRADGMPISGLHVYAATSSA
jgi:DNA-binding transcriptional ArsR family regulator